MVTAILIWLFLCAVVAAYATRKGRSFVVVFILAALLSPLLEFVFVLLFQPRQSALDGRRLATGDFMKCPACAELVRSEAKVCRYCGCALKTVTPA